MLSRAFNHKGDVIRVYQDREFAKTIHDDDQWPKPLRFLVGMVVEVHPNNQLPAQEASIGFGFRRRPRCNFVSLYKEKCYDDTQRTKRFVPTTL